MSSQDADRLESRQEASLDTSRRAPKAALVVAVGAFVLVAGSALAGRATRSGSTPTVRGLGSGAVGGVAAGWAMAGFTRLWATIERRLSKRAHDQRGAEQAATLKAAEVVVGHPIEPRFRGAASALVHYGIAGLAGAIYGATAALTPAARAGRGLLYGLAVWLLGDEAAAPALGLARGPLSYPLRTHARALAAHAVYGGTLDLVLRGLAPSPLRGRQR
ncbi:MAG: DUF1440 domain-containing protein [Polyangiaceae bacterium]